MLEVYYGKRKMYVVMTTSYLLILTYFLKQAGQRKNDGNGRKNI